MNLPIIQKKYWFISFSTFLVAISLVFFFTWGLNVGIDFTGGSLMEVKFNGNRPDAQLVEQELIKLDVKSLTTQPTDQNGLILRFQNTDEAKHQEVLSKIKELAGDTKTKSVTPIKVEGSNTSNIQVQTEATSVSAVEELRFESVGPSIGRQLKNNAILSLIIVAFLIICYVAWSFRKVSRPVASWKYGLAGVIALLHDVVIVVGAFSLMGHFWGVEVGTPFVAALLTVFGYSINDTIVVFDRIRENLPKSDTNFENTVNFSVNQTMKRSIYASSTTLLTLLAIIIYGGASIRYFAEALFIGIFFGTYSSVFLASPLLVLFEKYKKH